MIVAIPSKGRPGGVKSQKVIPSARVYVPSVEVSDYQRFGVENLVAVPDEIRGITKTRNWILDHEKEEDRIVFVDDDVKTQGWQQMGEHSLKKRALSEKSWMSAWARPKGLPYRCIRFAPLFGIPTSPLPAWGFGIVLESGLTSLSR